MSLLAMKVIVFPLGFHFPTFKGTEKKKEIYLVYVV